MQNRPRLLLTRPLHQQPDFARKAEALGFDCVSLPCIDIEFLPVDMHALPGSDGWLLFTSVNAVRAFEQARVQAGAPWPDVPVHAIGPATATALAEAGRVVPHVPPPPYSSEAWLDSIDDLALPATAIVVAGEGGRDRLVPGLHLKGFQASKLDVYRRRLPLIDDATRFSAFVEQAPDIVSVTSDAVLHNLLTLAGSHHVSRLLGLPLVVNSPRCADLARQMGFLQPPRVASPPGNDGQLRCLEQWLTEPRTVSAPAGVPTDQ